MGYQQTMVARCERCRGWAPVTELSSARCRECRRFLACEVLGQHLQRVCSAERKRWRYWERHGYGPRAEPCLPEEERASWREQATEITRTEYERRERERQAWRDRQPPEGYPYHWQWCDGCGCRVVKCAHGVDTVRDRASAVPGAAHDRARQLCPRCRACHLPGVPTPDG